MRAVVLGLALSAILTSTPSYAREYTPDISRSFPEISRLNQESVPELSQEAFHTHWCIQTIEAQCIKMYGITGGRECASDKDAENYIRWMVLANRNSATDQQRRIIRNKVEDFYGFGPKTNAPHVFSSNHIAAACSAKFYPISLDELRLKGSVLGLSQKAYHVQWCLQYHQALDRQVIYQTGKSVTARHFLRSRAFWEKEAAKYEVTGEQEHDVFYHLEQFYNFGQGKTHYFYTDAHYRLNCNPESKLDLFNTAKE